MASSLHDLLGEINGVDYCDIEKDVIKDSQEHILSLFVNHRRIDIYHIHEKSQ